MGEHATPRRPQVMNPDTKLLITCIIFSAVAWAVSAVMVWHAVKILLCI